MTLVLKLHPLRSLAAVFLVALIAAPGTVHAQGQCIRIMDQDSTLNSLIDPPGYKTGVLGKLGKWEKVGTGPQALILIPGLGFGGDIFREFMTEHKDKFTMYAVTLPGFGGTPAPPSPAAGISYGDMTWTNAAFGAIEKLIESEKIARPVILGHWLTGPQLALRLALKYPKNVRAVIIVSGSACFEMTDTTKMPTHPPLDKRILAIDTYVVPQWFKTVTRETWDDNNFLPQDYAVNPVRGLRLWREAAEPRLHVWVRYLCEFYSQDVTLELDSLKVPTLLLKPGLEGIDFDPGQNYMDAFCNTGWQAILPKQKMLTAVTIPNSRTCLWFDQPEKFESAIDDFLMKVK